jgi:hypothetical protein
MSRIPRTWSLGAIALFAIAIITHPCEASICSRLVQIFTGKRASSDIELKVDGILYCGDFDTADKPENPNKPFLWVGVRNSPPPATFGRVIYLENCK